MSIRVLVAAALPMALVACGSGDDPQLAMCQAVAKQLTGDTIASWEQIEQVDGGRSRHVQIAYGTADDGSGSIDCAFPIDEQGTVASGPDRVQLNGEPVERTVLLKAGVQASKEIIAGTAAETVARTQALAKEAGEKARDVADQARDAAVDAGKALQQTLEQ